MTEISSKKLEESLKFISRRLDLLERIFGEVMECRLRLDTLEFNSGKPTNPAIGETLLDIKLRIKELELIVLKKEQENE